MRAQPFDGAEGTDPKMGDRLSGGSEKQDHGEDHDCIVAKTTRRVAPQASGSSKELTWGMGWSCLLIKKGGQC